MADALDKNTLASFRAQDATDLTDIGLLRRAQPLAEAFKDRLPLARELADINSHFGVEIAQTVFSLALEQSPTYGAFIRRVRSFDLRAMHAPARAAAANFEVTVVASALPIKGQTSSFEERWRTWARSLGFTTDVIHTEADGDLRSNAQLISRYLLSHPHPRRILVTYGSGAAEFRALLNMRMGLRTDSSDTEPAAELQSVALWLNVAGAYSGSSYARLKNESWFEKLKIEFSKYFGRRAVLDRARLWRQLDPRLPAWRSSPVFPRTMKVINIVGLPLRSELPPGLMTSHLELSTKIGPNDGAVGVFEAIAHPGLIVPIPGMSHRAESIKLEPIFKRVLAAFATEASAPRNRESSNEHSAEV